MSTRVIVGNELSERDPARRPCLDVDLPRDCRRVYSGAVKPGDLFLSAIAAEQGTAIWLFVEDLAGSADDYLCLVRPDNSPVEQACERCKAYVRHGPNRFCRECCEMVVKAGRS